MVGPILLFDVLWLVVRFYWTDVRDVVSSLYVGQTLMAVFTSAPQGSITTMHPDTLGVTAGDIFAVSTMHNMPSSTGDVTNEVAELFLQTRGAKAIAGVFAFASILVTCIQVGCVYEGHSISNEEINERICI